MASLLELDLLQLKIKYVDMKAEAKQMKCNHAPEEHEILQGSNAFGWRTRQMGQTLAAENTLPMYDGDLTPSGRPTKADADRNFERYAQEAEDNSEDWRAWFRLAVAYDDARDRKRARAAMRQASNLYVRSLRS